MSDHNQVRRMLLATSREGARLFRQNTGMAWAGQAQKFRRQATVQVEPGDVVIRQARPFHGGLCKGSADMIGPSPLKITEDMVGATVAVFTAIEAKSGNARLTPDQQNFLKVMRQLGGIAGVARSPEEAVALVRDGPELFLKG